MKAPLRVSLLVCGFSVLVVSGASAFQNKKADSQNKWAEQVLAQDERAVLRNRYGAIVQDSNGKRINYSKEELEAQELRAGVDEASTQSLVSEAAPSTITAAAWGYAAFGSGIGLSNIVIAQNGATPEMYMGGSSATFGGNGYWYALRYNATTHDYEQTYVSPFFSSGIRRIKAADVIGDSAPEIIVALQDGHILLYDQETKALISTITTPATDLFGLEVADVDGDGANELVLCTTNHLYVCSGTGVLKWDLANVGGYDVVVGQMDQDSALEIAVTDGHVVDCGTHLAQWTWSYGFGSRLGLADFDGDQMQELIVGEYGFVWAYDVDRQLPKWSISEYVEALLVADIDGDGYPEVLVGQGQWGSVIAYDPVTQQQKGSIHNPEHGVTNLAVGDVDSDGIKDLLWGAGASSTGPDYLYVANWQTRQIKWQNIDLVGPFIGPEIGDLDGDGLDELVVISTASNSSYSSGRILVFDALTRRLRAISGPTMGGLGWTGIHDLKLRDIKGDGRKEILVAASDTYDGLIEIYTFDSNNTFALDWQNATRPYGAPFYSVDAADIDGDGAIEIVGGVGQAHSGTQGIYIYVYSYATRNEIWHSLHMGWGPITGLGLADLNQDGAKEIIGMVNGRDVYIFDGPSKQLEAILTGPFTAMRVQDVAGLPSIVLGNSSGDLIMDRYSSGSYSETYRQRLINGRVNGFTLDSQERVWIGSSDGQYGSPGMLTEVTLAGAVLATYSGYGSVFGLHTAFYPASSMFFTTGSYSIEGFPVGVPLTTIGAYSPSDQTFYLRNSNSPGFADLSIQYGPPGAIPLVGDWDGNGTATIGVFDPNSQTFYLRNSNTPGFADITIRYGPPGAIPIAGDWNGDGVTTIGVYDPASQTFYLRNTNTPGFADLTIRYGPPGAVPVVGDWDGNGTTTIGVYDPSSQTFYLRNSNTIGFADLTIRYGPSGATPVVGDWDGNGTVTIGVYDPANQTFYLRNSNTIGFADLTIRYGPSGATPLAGDWNGL